MMAIKVIKQYVDKYTKKEVRVGATLANISPEREKELLEAGVIEKIETKKNTKKDEK